MRSSQHAARMGETKNGYKILVRKLNSREYLGVRSRSRREGNIKMDVREIGFEHVDWIHLDQDGVHWRAFVNTTKSTLLRKRLLISLLSQRLLACQ
jgi:hypothetical protein